MFGETLIILVVKHGCIQRCRIVRYICSSPRKSIALITRKQHCLGKSIPNIFYSTLKTKSPVHITWCTTQRMSHTFWIAQIHDNTQYGMCSRFQGANSHSADHACAFDQTLCDYMHPIAVVQPPLAFRKLSTTYEAGGHAAVGKQLSKVQRTVPDVQDAWAHRCSLTPSAEGSAFRNTSINSFLSMLFHAAARKSGVNTTEVRHPVLYVSRYTGYFTPKNTYLCY